jgi:adenosylcobinamide-GDP ribazoletransferase
MTDSTSAPPRTSRAAPPFIVGARAAFVLLTRLPVGGFPYDAASFRWASAHHPLVGATIGALLAACWHVVSPLGPFAAATIAVGLGVLLTGAIHEDGLADAADALGGGQTRDAVFAILKDSRIGAFGAAALCLSLLLRVSLLASLGAAAPAALVAVHSAARAVPVFLMTALPYVTPRHAAKSRHAAQAGLPQASVATLWVLLVLGGTLAFHQLSPSQVAGIAAAGAIVTAACARYYRARLGGVTGDLLGAAEQISECAMLFATAWLGRVLPS